MESSDLGDDGSHENSIIFYLVKALLSWLRDNGLSKYLTSSAYYDIDLPAFIRKVTALSFLNIEAINDTYKEIIATEQPRFPAGWVCSFSGKRGCSVAIISL